LAVPLIRSDFLFMLILVAFGISNGWVSSQIMIAAASLEHNKFIQKDEVDTAATVGSFCIVGGLVIGSLFSFGARAAICRCNPFIE